MENLKAVIFDLDNTLLDRSNTFHRFARSFAAHYFPHILNHDSIVKRIVSLDEDGYKDKNELFNELLVQLPWNDKPLRYELMEFYAKHYVEQACLMEHATEVLQYVGNSYKVGLITNGKTSIQYGKIDQLEIRSYFDFILVSEEVGVKKPHPAIFEMALQHLRLPEDQCVYIGDHPLNDIEGAGKLGMNTIWIEVNQPWKDELTVKPQFRITHLNELLHIL